MNIHKLNVNRQGQIVLNGVLWLAADAKRSAVSVYAYRGNRRKVRVLIKREYFDKGSMTKGDMSTLMHNTAHLWAMENGISDFEYIEGHVDPYNHVLHPDHYKQENQP